MIRSLREERCPVLHHSSAGRGGEGSQLADEKKKRSQELTKLQRNRSTHAQAQKSPVPPTSANTAKLNKKETRSQEAQRDGGVIWSLVL